MSDKPKVYVAGVGMITAVGADAEMTAAAVKAGVGAYQETAYFDKAFNKIKMALVPEGVFADCLDEELLQGDLTSKQARMLQLAKNALSDLVSSIPEGLEAPLFIAGPESVDSTELGINQLFLENVEGQSGIKIDKQSSRVISTGRAGSLSVINLAFRYFENSPQDYVVVGAVDTYYDKQTLDSLDKRDRLLCGPATDGFIPGEAAVFLLLSRVKNEKDSEAVCFYEAGSGFEKGHLYSDEVYTGDGLSEACSMAINNTDVTKIKSVYASLNGESHFAKEYGVAMTRNSGVLAENVKTFHPADCVGDLGAATGLVYAGIIASNIQADRALMPALICCSSDKGQRTAVVVHHSS
jgi:3-oxoacyl-[acyl-carrier-protein] synthase-1